MHKQVTRTAPGASELSGLLESGTARSKYSIAPEVYACRTSELTVFLDLARNRYVGVGPTESDMLATIVDGWPRRLEGGLTSPENKHVVPISSPEATSAIDALVAQGLLKAVASHSSTSTLNTTAVAIDGELVSIGDELDGDSSIEWHHVLNFFRAFVGAKFALRWLSLRRIVYSVAGRRPVPASEDDHTVLDETVRLVCIFRRIRPWVFRAKDNCLLHALVLVKFLDLYRIPATWVFGVKVNPWGAHTWAQQGRYLLDTNPEKVCTFTPILGIQVR